MRFASLVLSACVLIACGGGGGGGGGYVSTLIGGQVVSAPTAFDSFFVSPNASYYATGTGLPSTGLPATGTNAAPAFLYDVAMSLPRSPSAGTQRVISVAPSDLTHTPLGLPASQSTNTYLVDGGFYKQGSPATHEISYSNGEVVDTLLSEDGQHRLMSIAFVQINVNSLTGAIVSDSSRAKGLLPPEIYTNPDLTKPGAAWGTGAAYTSSIVRYDTDTYIASNILQRANTTIQQLIDKNALSGIPGSLTSQKGVPIYVASSPQVAGGITSYAMLYERDGNVYTGSVLKAGSVVTSSKTYNTQARDSIKAALNF